MASMYTLCQLSDDEKAQVKGRGYQILRVLSHGSCSLVYLCEYTQSNESESTVKKSQSSPLRLVCKVMEAMRAPKDFTQKFLPRELSNLIRLRPGNLPHIIHVHSILQYKSKVMVFMRHAELGNLCDYIRTNHEKVTEKVAKFWFRQLAVALNYLHTMEIAHRDIKCENILLTAHFNVKLTDFGFSRLCADHKGKQIYSNTFCGSMGYAAPELLKGIPYNPKPADVWSLGVVLFTLLNANMPFLEQNPTLLWKAQNEKNYSFRKSVRKQLPKSAIHLVNTMLEPSPFERPSAEEIVRSGWILTDSNIKFAHEYDAMVYARYIKKRKEERVVRLNTSDSIITITHEQSPPSSDQEFSSD